MRHSCRFLPPPLLSLRSTARGRTDLHKMGAEVFPLPFSLSLPLFPCLAGWRGNCRHGKPSSSESGQELSLQRGWLSLYAWKWRGREGEKSGNHILRVSGTDGHDMPNSPRSLPLCRNHSPFASASSKWVLSLSLCPNLHRSCDINSANHLRSAEERAASECSADGATQPQG